MNDDNNRSDDNAALGNTPLSAGPLLIFIGTQYAAAWSELGTRITNRQNVMQIYVPVSSVMFGFYLSVDPNKASYLPEFLAAAITAFTLISSVLIWVHDRVIIQLRDLKAKCELQSYHVSGKHDALKSLFYFHPHEDSELPKNYHTVNQRWQRYAFGITLAVFNLAAIVIAAIAAYTTPELWRILLCSLWGGLMVVSMVLLLRNKV